ETPKVAGQLDRWTD
ncbi:MAG: hypothetical protein EZS28_052712, partial [Streblomastix strix]